MRILPSSRRSVGEFVCAASLLAFGAFIVLDGLQYPVLVDGVVGPGLMPLAWGAGLTAVSIVLVLNALRGMSSTNDLPAKPAEANDLSIADFSEDDGEAAGSPTTVIGILLLLAISTLLAPLVGLMPMLGVLVFVCVFVFEREGFLTAALMSIGTMAVGWAVFAWLFEVPLPTGSVWQALGL